MTRNPWSLSWDSKTWIQQSKQHQAIRDLFSKTVAGSRSDFSPLARPQQITGFVVFWLLGIHCKAPAQEDWLQQIKHRQAPLRFAVTHPINTINTSI